MATPLPPSAFMGVHEHRVAHHPDLEALEILDLLDRLLRVVDVARPGVHPAQADKPGRRVVGELLQQLLADFSVYHLFHVRGVAEHKGRLKTLSSGTIGPMGPTLMRA